METDMVFSFKSIWKDFCVVLVLFEFMNCYPIHKIESDNKLEKDEKKYPNGTIVGKYSYMDNEGNPIQVKYYADDSSYGIELKSVKVMEDSSNNLKQISVDNMNSQQNTENPAEINPEFYNPPNIKDKTADTFELLNKEVKTTPFKEDLKESPDYEIYFQNELRAPKKCGKEKVRVYFDKNKRKARDISLPNSYADAVKYCEKI